MTFLDITVTIFGIFASKAILHYDDWFYIYSKYWYRTWT